MKNILIVFLFLFHMSCIETDQIEDEIIVLTIEVDNAEQKNNTTAGIVGTEVMVTAKATNDFGVSFTADVSWSSSNTDVAAINSTGTIDLIAAGQTTITAVAYGLEASLVLNVVNSINDPALIELTAPKTSLDLNEQLMIESTVFNVLNEEITGVMLTWNSDNENVITVSQEGTATAISAGEATITASTGSISAIIKFLVGAESIRTGQFSGLNGYSVSGDVRLMKDNDDNLYLELGENFTASSGPGLYIYLSNNSTNVSGGFEIGALEMNQGPDSYFIGNTIALDQYDHVLVWCKPFGVGFGTATLN